MLKLLRFGGVFLCLSASSYAGVIYGNLGPGDSYSTDLSVLPDSSPLWEAVVFSAVSTANLVDILAPVGAGNGVMSFGLYTDGGTQPGSLLESWADIPVTSTYGAAPLTDLTSVLNPLLTAGTTYWFVASTTDGPLWWDLSSTSDTQNNFESFNDSLWLGPFADSPGLALQVDSAPEPGTGVLLACSAIGVAAWRRNLRRRIKTSPAEPRLCYATLGGKKATLTRGFGILLRYWCG